jgi:hypothetical protein
MRFPCTLLEFQAQLPDEASCRVHLREPYEQRERVGGREAERAYEALAAQQATLRGRDVRLERVETLDHQDRARRGVILRAVGRLADRAGLALPVPADVDVRQQRQEVVLVDRHQQLGRAHTPGSKCRPNLSPGKPNELVWMWPRPQLSPGPPTNDA